MLYQRDVSILCLSFFFGGDEEQGVLSRLGAKNCEGKNKMREEKKNRGERKERSGGPQGKEYVKGIKGKASHLTLVAVFEGFLSPWPFQHIASLLL